MAAIDGIIQMLGVACEQLDTTTNYCCFNKDTFKMFCAKGAIAAGALGIDTLTAGSCDANAAPCN